MNTKCTQTIINTKCPYCDYVAKYRGCLATHVTRVHRIAKLEAETAICNSLFGEKLVKDTIDRYRREELCFADITWSKDPSIPDVSTLIQLLGLKRSSSEERHTQRYKDKYLKGIQAKYGKGITNISQAHEVQKKKEKTFSKTWGSYDNYLKYARLKMRNAEVMRQLEDPELAKKRFEKVVETLHSKYGNHINNPAQIPSARAKISKTHKEIMSKLNKDELKKATERARTIRMNILRSLPTKEDRKRFMGVHKRKNCGFISGIEKRVQRLLESKGIVFAHNIYLFNYNWDLVFDDKKIIVEIQGNFFHANPRMYDADDEIPLPMKSGVLARMKSGVLARDLWNRDAEKKETAECNGWSVRYLWEDEINSCSTDEELMNLVLQKVPELPCQSAMQEENNNVAIGENHEDRKAVKSTNSVRGE